ncbi:uncharacterized protein PSFLO_05265 [Pseudozyma flocculosa]|uniref:Uncharacterized protein n=1 Tax=Pseudozyma flocculosa TaxID=84751 RepID=A0A5C3F5K6_9BASI|nr:uncharacterized protein PSFLO_05265 [Pseudozyma flocculosa]
MQDGHKLSMLRFTSKNRNFPTYLVCLDTPQHWRVTMPDRRTEYVWKFDWGKPEHFHWALYPNECKTGCAGPVRGTRTDRGSCYVLQINQVGNEALRFRTLVQAFKDGADSTLHFQVGSESVVRGPKLSSRDLPRR